MIQLAWQTALVLGLPFGLVNWIIWRPSGPAHRWRAAIVSRYPKKD